MLYLWAMGCSTHYILPRLHQQPSVPEAEAAFKLSTPAPLSLKVAGRWDEGKHFTHKTHKICKLFKGRGSWISGQKPLCSTLLLKVDVEIRC